MAAYYCFNTLHNKKHSSINFHENFMKKITTLLLISISLFTINVSFKQKTLIENFQPNSYSTLFQTELSKYSNSIHQISEHQITEKEIHSLRIELKNMDFWLRYFEPLAYKKLNGPLPVEYETEVFEKFEKPYKRIGGGLTLAEIALEENMKPDSLLNMSLPSIEIYKKDSIQQLLSTYNHFYFCNRLYLLNLATIYSTGFECPDTNRIIPELKSMIEHTTKIYNAFDESFPSFKLPNNYWNKFNELSEFMKNSSSSFSDFDHFTFIKEYINPLFQLNQTCIQKYGLTSKNIQDYSLNNKATSIFSKELYQAQSNKGIFHRVTNLEVLNQIKKLGELLFYDPILSGNNQRSCASCHNPALGFTTQQDKPMDFNASKKLNRNSPTLLNSNFQHLIMQDGKHINLHLQAHDVISNEEEMNGKSEEIINKILSCKEYKSLLKNIAKNTPGYTKISMEHITSALVYYYTSFSFYDAPFDDIMNNKLESNPIVQKGFNLFMGKSNCATCHFLPQFNGVKPPYTGSEFEVLGVPISSDNYQLDEDKGRGIVNPVDEMQHAFRTNTIRNSSFTAPYMHNGCFKTMKEVIEFYNEGGGNGKKMNVKNQTLSEDNLNLSENEIELLIEFIKSLDEKIPTVKLPVSLPISKDPKLNKRIVSGTY